MSAHTLLPSDPDADERGGRGTIWRYVRKLLAWIGTHDRATVLTLLVVGASVWAFQELGDYAGEAETHRLDRRILLSMRSADDPADPLGPHWLEETVRDFTALGGFGALAFFTLAAAGFIVLREKRATALYLVAAVTSGVVVSLLLKSVYARPRPDLVAHGTVVYTKSFPSGHSMLAAVTYLTLGALLARVQPTLRLKAYVLGCALVLMVLVGLSRVYLGVHWPSDVLAGWAAGSGWAALAWYVARRLERRGRIEPEELPPDLEDAAAAPR